MKIVDQHWNDEVCPLTDVQPRPLICTGVIIIIIWIIVKIGIKLAKVGSKLTSQRDYGNVRINIPTAPLSPVPATLSVNRKNHSAEIIQNVIRQNKQVQFPLKQNKAQIEALLLHYSCTTVPEQDTN